MKKILTALVLVAVGLFMVACEETPVEEKVNFTLTVQQGGTVTGGQTGEYTKGTELTLTAVANDGYTFGGYYNGSTLAQSALTYTFKLEADTTIEARFTQNTVVTTYTFNRSATTGGSVSGTANGTYDSGTDISVTATPANGYIFVGWYNGNILASANPAYTFKLNANTTLEARFEVMPVMKLPAVDDLAYDDEIDMLTWEEVIGSDGYLVEIFDEDGELVLSSDGEITTSLSVASLGKGTYTAVVVTYAPANSPLEDSDEAELEFTIESLGDLESPANLKVEDGYLVWDETDARTVSVKVYELDTLNEVDEYNVSFFTANKLFLTDLGVEDGNYTIGIQFKSNRHDVSETEEVTIKISIETLVIYNAADIAEFSGETLTGGEHAAASLVTVGGVDFARVVPTADGWGRVASPKLDINFSNNPVVFLKLGTVIGGFHMQLSVGGSYYSVLGDTASNQSRNINLTKGNESTLIGTQEGFLRLGVNQMTGVGAADVAVDYEQVVIAYVNEFRDASDLDELTVVENVRLNFLGYVIWDLVEYADGYYVTITNQDDEVIMDEVTVVAPQVEVRQLPEGLYTISVVAYNEEYELLSPHASDAYQVIITDVITYTAADMLTWGNENGMSIALDEEDSSLAVINSEKLTTWGRVFPNSGITLNMDRNPFIINNVAKVSGGYFYSGIFDGNGQFPYKNDTPANVDVAHTWIFRANVNVDRQTVNTKDFSGIVTNFVIKPGIWHAGGDSFSQIWMESIRIVYVEEYVDVEVPVEVLPAPTPSGFDMSRGILKWNSVSVPSGAPAPLYQVTITNKADENDVIVLEPQLTAQVVLSNLQLTAGATYEFSVVALGDHSGEEDADMWYSDSLAGKVNFSYTENFKVSDFSDLLEVELMDGDFLPETELGANNSLIIKGQNAGWNIIKFAAIDATSVTGLNDGKTVLIMQLGEVVGNSVMHFGYYRVGSDAIGYQRIWGDSGYTTNQLRVSGDWVYPGMVHTPEEGAPFIQFFSGFGGGDAGRSVEIKSIILATYLIVE